MVPVCILIARNAAALDAVAAEIGELATTAPADRTDHDAVQRAIGILDRVDHLVITAVADELARAAPIIALSSEQVERSFDRLRGYVNCVQAAAPLLGHHASITLWCGASGVRPPAQGFSLLAAESASVTGLGRALALELAPVRVNVLMSGVVDTAIHAHDREELQAWAERELPARRLGQPEDLADAALFLMTHPYATAQTFLVDGGITAI